MAIKPDLRSIPVSPFKTGKKFESIGIIVDVIK
jgi:hypothetical protein